MELSAWHFLYIYFSENEKAFKITKKEKNYTEKSIFQGLSSFSLFWKESLKLNLIKKGRSNKKEEEY